MFLSMRTLHWLPVTVLSFAAVVGAGPRADTPPAGSERTSESRGRVLLTLEEALEAAFPECEVERSTVFLDKEQKKRAQKLSGVPLVSGIIYPYTATKREPKTGKRVVVGTAYFETHRVRSLRETMMFVVSPEGKIQRAEVLAFYEPLDYLPNARFYAQFKGRKLDADLSLKRGIRSVAGCSLSARAATNAARRILSIHQVVHAGPLPKGEDRDSGE